MLTLTESAVTVIRDLTERQEAPDRAGVRIAAEQSGSLAIRIAPAPLEGDQVLDESGARLFLDSEAAVALEDKALDAGFDPQGSVKFAVVDQAG